MEKQDYIIAGTIIQIGDVQEFGDKGFRKLEFVINDGADYPQTIPFEVHKDKCDLMGSFNEGDEVKIHFDVQGRYWEKGDRYFGSLRAWKVELVNAAEGTQDAADGVCTPELDTTPAQPDIDDEIPF